MTQHIPLPAVLVGSGDPLSCPYYLVISGPRLDVYVSLNGPNNTSGWIRVIGLEILAEVGRVLRECTFNGHQITCHDPGYNYTHGFGAILIHGPFCKDKYLFLSSDIPSSFPRPSPTVAAGDPAWFMTQALPPPPAVQHPLTPSSPSHSTLRDFTAWRYAHEMPCQMPPHLQPAQNAHPQIQTQPERIPSLPSSQAPPTPSWVCGSPLAERNQYQQAWPQIQVAHTQDARFRLILSWNGPGFAGYHHPRPHPGAPIHPWAPTSPTTSPITGMRHRGSYTQSGCTRKRLCTIIHRALAWLQNDGWILECSADMAIATFPTQQCALQVFHELSTRLEQIAVRLPYSSEELAILENSGTMRPCTHRHQCDFQGQGYKHQRDNHGHIKHAKLQSPVLLPPSRRERIKPQPSRPLTGNYRPPAEEFPKKQNTQTDYDKTQYPTNSPGVLIVDGTSRRQDEKDNTGPVVGLGLGTEAPQKIGIAAHSPRKAKVLVVNGSSRDLTRHSTGPL